MLRDAAVQKIQGEVDHLSLHFKINGRLKHHEYVLGGGPGISATERNFRTPTLVFLIETEALRDTIEINEKDLDNVRIKLRSFALSEPGSSFIFG